MSFCSIIVEGNNFEKSELEKEIGLKSTRYLSKGQISRDGSKMERNRWIHNRKFDDISSLELSLSALLEALNRNIEYIHRLNYKNSVYVNCFINSESAQIEFRLSNNIIRKLSLTKLPIYFSIFSWGDI